MSNRRDIQRAKRGKLFLKGPIYFGWIRQNIKDPTARLLLVACIHGYGRKNSLYPYIKSMGLCWNK